MMSKRRKRPELTWVRYQGVDEPWHLYEFDEKEECWVTECPYAGKRAEARTVSLARLPMPFKRARKTKRTPTGEWTTCCPCMKRYARILEEMV